MEIQTKQNQIGRSKCGILLIYHVLNVGLLKFIWLEVQLAVRIWLVYLNVS